MALLICDAGQIHLLDLMLKTALSIDESFTLHLFQNNIIPNTSSTVDDFTECNFSGYSVITLDRSSWLTPVNEANAAKTTYTEDPILWHCTGAGNVVYGAYVLNGDGDLVWADLFPDAETLVNGDVLSYLPVFTFTTG